MIYVTKPHLPPLEEMMPYLEKIWTSGIVSNSGPFHQELETQMADYWELNIFRYSRMRQ